MKNSNYSLSNQVPREKDFSSTARGISLSFIIHLAILALFIFGIPNFSKKLPQEISVSVDILPVTDRTNVKESNRKLKQAKRTPPKNKVIPKYKEAQKPTSKLKNSVILAKSKNLDKKTAENHHKNIMPKLKPKKEIKKLHMAKNAPTPTPIMKPKIKKEARKKLAKNEDLDFDSLLKTLEKTSIKDDDQENNKNISRTNNKFKRHLPLTISQQDDLRRQLETCWSPPSGARNASTTIVAVRMLINLDGTVTSAKIVNAKRYNNNNTLFRAAADAAVRAVRKCSPLQNLPRDKYDSWRELEFNFDPSQMIY